MIPPYVARCPKHLNVEPCGMCADAAEPTTEDYRQGWIDGVAATPPADQGVLQLAKDAALKLPNLIARYWDLAHAEGTEGRTHDTENGTAMKTLSKINAALAAINAALEAKK